MRRKLSVRGVDQDAVETLYEIRDIERRLTGALVSDAIRVYHDYLYDDEADGGVVDDKPSNPV